MTTRASGMRTGLFVAAILLLLSVISVEPPDAQRLQANGDFNGQVEGTNGGTVGGGTTGPGSPVGGGTTGPGSPVGGGTGGTGGTAGKNLACKAGQNGGSTDKGVTGSKIRLASTNVRSGTGASFLGTSYIGMQAAVARVNAKGGICGRLIQLDIKDDGWNAARGDNFIKNFIKEGYFALAVVPSSEGLTQSIVNGTISGAGIPVVGTDGMLKHQYLEPWVWPVATPTVSTMRIMVKHAIDEGAQSFGIVYDKRYRFGREGADAFRDYVQSVTGNRPKAFIGIEPEKPNYGGDAKAFNDACGPEQCDFVAMLLDPTTANTYIKSQPEVEGKKRGFGRILTGGAQPLFNEEFARGCGKACHGMLVWTGYNPPIGRLSSLPDLATYVNDVRSISPSVDVNNQFLEGAYLGMRVLLNALEKVGPNLTRAALRDVMNSTTYSSNMSAPLTWRENQRFANQAAQAFRIVTAAGSFAGFQEEGSGFIKDPTPGVLPKGD